MKCFFRPQRVLGVLLPLAASVFLVAPGWSANQHNDFEDAPFDYGSAEKRDPFTLLQRAVAEGKVQLKGGSPTVFLRDLLEKLHIPAESQTLVFSKTAFQRRVVTSDNLRAVYFNDDVYLTYIPGGRIEVASTDPTLGSVFSIFDPVGGPKFPKVESPRACLGCHAGSFTNFLPGPMLRTVVSDAEGQIIFDYPENNRGHGVAFKERWGSWVVQGAPPDLPHLGNLVAERKDGQWVQTKEKFATDKPVTEFCKTMDLPAQGSDAVALMILDHQVAAQNKIIDAGYRWRHAVDKLNEKRRKADEAAPMLSTLDAEGLEEAEEWTGNLLHHLTYGDEVALPAAFDLKQSVFAKVFQAPGGLRELSGGKRLFRHRLSYLVHGLSFQGWPKEFQHFFWNQLKAGFTAKTAPKALDHLETQEKADLLAVIRKTVKGLPEGF